MARLRSILTTQAILLTLAASGLSAQVDTPQRRLVQPPPGSLSGTVWDSTRSAPLSQARVVLFGTEHATETDAEGRFHLEGLSPGPYSVAFNHPRLDTLVAFPGVVEVAIESGETSRVTLGVPSMGTIMATVCAFQILPKGTAPLVGTVRSLPGGERIPRAHVTVRWSQDRTSEQEFPPDSPLWMQTRTDAAGRYVLCGVPANRSISVEASFLAREGAPETILVTEGDHTVRDLGITLPPGFVITRTGASILAEGAGTQGVQGWIREPGSGAPVRNVELTLRQTPGAIVITGETSSRGFFRLRTPVPGTYSLEGRALGYGEVAAANLTVEEGRLVVLDIEMGPDPLELEPLVAVGEPRQFQLEVQGFYDRKEEGFGYFITPEQLEKWAPVNHGQVFRRIPGIMVLDESGFSSRLVMHRPNLQEGPVCTPQLYVDGALVQTSRAANNPEERGVSPDQVVSIRDLEAIEFYPGSATVPLVWGGTSPGRCGTIVMWTKMG